MFKAKQDLSSAKVRAAQRRSVAAGQATGAARDEEDAEQSQEDEVSEQTPAAGTGVGIDSTRTPDGHLSLSNLRPNLQQLQALQEQLQLQGNLQVLQEELRWTQGPVDDLLQRLQQGASLADAGVSPDEWQQVLQRLQRPAQLPAHVPSPSNGGSESVALNKDTQLPVRRYPPPQTERAPA